MRKLIGCVTRWCSVEPRASGGLCASASRTYIDGAAQQRVSLQGFAYYPVQVSGSTAELVHLRHTPCEVLEPLSGASSGQSLVGATQPEATVKENTLVCNDFLLPRYTSAE